MQAPGENTISIVDPQSQTYADNNLNEKTLSTQYIYTTEGQLIPATQEVPTGIDISTQHFDAAQVTVTQGIHIQQVDYQYQQQYSDGTIETVPSDGQQFVQDPSFVVTENEYITENQTTMETSNVSEIRPVMPTYEYAPATSEENYEDSAGVESTASFVANFDPKVEEEQPQFKDVQIEPGPPADEPIEEVLQENSKEIQTEDIVETHSTNNMQIEEEELQTHETELHDSKNAISEQNAIDLVESHTVGEEREPIEQHVANESEDCEKAEELYVSQNTVMEDTNVSMDNSTESETVIEDDTNNLLIEEADSKNQISETSENSSTQIEPIEEMQEEILMKSSIMNNPEEILTVNCVQDIETTEISADLIPSQANVEIIERDGDDSTDTLENSEVQETMVIVYEESSQEGEFDDEQSYVEEFEENQSEAEPLNTDSEKAVEETAKVRRPRGRKPKTDIPLHILGHNVNNPVDSIVNGKTPKPRLGVKVPYRNLTSQIVSKQDIEKEILERGLKRQKKEAPFARQLTARLAKKLASTSNQVSAKQIKTKKSEDFSETAKSNSEIESQDVSTPVDSSVENTQKEKSNNNSSGTTIENNSDLLAILEGKDEPEEIIAPKITSTTEPAEETMDETSLKNLEREIALQQLQDLPYLSPSTRFIKGRSWKPYFKALPNVSILSDGTASIAPSAKTAALNQTKSKQTIDVKPTPKSVVTNKIQDKKMLDEEPQIKMNMALKTYSRKRKSIDNVPELQPTKKIPIADSTTQIDLKTAVQPQTLSEGAYVTKSSRIIKKKVIWDPDEIPIRAVVTKSVTVKTEHPVRMRASPVKSDNKITEKADKKPEVKPIIEKKGDEKVATKKVTQITSPEKKPSPLGNKTKKLRSEVDKLLGDEGTIKMLYDLKTSDEHVEEKRRKNVISVEKTFKDLAKKANQIKSDLVNISSVESPKSLRKKDAIVSPVSAVKAQPPSPAPASAASPTPSGISRQKSKDSARSTPPRSPSFSFPNETSYLIRRRSSSSISSGGEGSVELNDDQERVLRKKTRGSSLSDSKSKRTKKTSDQKEEGDLDLKHQRRTEHKIGQYNSFIVKKGNKSVTIDLHAGHKKGYFTSELLGELTVALQKISKEKDCNIVLIKSSNDKTFSLGLDYSVLLSDKEHERKAKASDLAEKVSGFIKCLLHFPKILVASIEGVCCGLAVTMLPLFDIVIASDLASFSSNYSSLGTVAEAGFLLSAPFVASHGLAGELFYISQPLTADEACRKGLITRVCWPEKYQDTVKQVVTAIAKGSKQSLEGTKKQVQLNFLEAVEIQLETMKKQLVEFWTSPECQKNFSNAD